MEQNEFFVCNGRSTHDSPANITFSSTYGNSVIDLLWCSFDCVDLIADFKVLKLSTLSDHFPIHVSLQGLFFNSSKSLPVNKQTKLEFNFEEIENLKKA